MIARDLWKSLPEFLEWSGYAHVREVVGKRLAQAVAG